VDLVIGVQEHMIFPLFVNILVRGRREKLLKKKTFNYLIKITNIITYDLISK
jgi:hypothetical protein